jgi:16S rRNA processing protein RimM
VRDERLVVIGEIARPHGLAGEVCVIPHTDDPARFGRVGACVLWDPARERREPARVTAARVHGDAVLVTLEGCESVEAARGLVGRLIALPADEARALPPGRFYPWQLEGCRVVTEEGTDVGTVSGIEPSPAHDLWVVRDGAREHLIPAVPAIVVEVSLADRRVVIRPPEGLLEL